MHNLLNLKKYERKSFRRHFLASVHSEIRFSPIDVSKILERERALVDALSRSGFTECRKVVHGQITFHSEQNKSAKLSQEATTLGLLFVGQSPRREFQLEGERLIVSDFSYDSIENFLDRFRTYWQAVDSVVGLSGDVQVHKVGLRKVNAIVVQPALSFQNALSVFNPALFGLARSGVLVKEALRGTEEVAVLERSNELCVIRTTLQSKEENALEATLDFDVVSTELRSIDEAFSNTLLALNNVIFDLFMWAVTTDMIELMERE